MTADRLVRDLADAPPGPALGALLDTVDPAGAGPEVAVALLRGWSRQRAHDHARMCAAMVRVADLSRAASAGSPLHARAGSEIAAALTRSEAKAARELDFAEALGGLSAVAAAFEAGSIDHGKAWVFLDVFGAAELTAGQCEAVCAVLLPHAPGWTAGQLRHRLVRAVLAVDPDWAARRYERAVRERGMRGYLAPDGTATITASGSAADEAAAACARVDTLAARIRTVGHPGTPAQIRAEVFLRLLDGSLTGMDTEQIIATLAGEYRGQDTEPGAAAGNGRTPDTHGTPGDGTDAAATEGSATEGSATEGSATEGSATEGSATEAAAGGSAVSPPAPVRALQPGPVWRSASGWPLCSGATSARASCPAGARSCPTSPVRSWPASAARSGASRSSPHDGHLVLAGLTRRRPRIAGAIDQVPGGIVELHVTATELAAHATEPAAHAEWAGVVADLAEQFARGDELRAALDARPDARLVRGALLRHV